MDLFVPCKASWPGLPKPNPYVLDGFPEYRSQAWLSSPVRSSHLPRPRRVPHLPHRSAASPPILLQSVEDTGAAFHLPQHRPAARALEPPLVRIRPDLAPLRSPPAPGSPRRRGCPPCGRLPWCARRVCLPALSPPPTSPSPTSTRTAPTGGPPPRRGPALAWPARSRAEPSTRLPHPGRRVGREFAGHAGAVQGGDGSTELLLASPSSAQAPPRASSRALQPPRTYDAESTVQAMFPP